MKLKKGQYEIDGIIFTRKGKKLVRQADAHGAAWAYVNMDLKAADGTLFDAVGVFCESDHGEHYSTLILLDGEIVVQGEAGFLHKIAKTKDEFFPYKYRPRKPLVGDIHVGENGWSK